MLTSMLNFDWRSLLISVVIALLSAFVLVQLLRWQKTRSSIWWSFGAIGLGVGIWSMYFTSMLGLKVVSKTSYDLLVTISSLFAITYGTWLSFYIASRNNSGENRYAVASIVLGTAMVSMHYLSMEAMNLDDLFAFSSTWSAVSLITTLSMAFCVINLAWNDSVIRYTLLKRDAEVALAIALCLLVSHYVSVYAITVKQVQHAHAEIIEAGLRADLPSVVVASGFLLLTGAVVVISAMSARMRSAHKKTELQNVELEAVVQERTAALQEALKQNEIQMQKLAVSNNRQKVISETLQSIQELDHEYDRIGDLQEFNQRIIAIALKNTAAKVGGLIVTEEDEVILHNELHGPDVKAEGTEVLVSANAVLEFCRKENVVGAIGLVRELRPVAVWNEIFDSKNLIVEPILCGTKCRGAIYLAKPSGTKEFDIDELTLLGFYAKELAHVIQRHDLLSKLKKKNDALIKEKNEQQVLFNQLHDAQQQLLQFEKMASIGQLAAGVAHEINNPVGYINSNIITLKTYIDGVLRLLKYYQDRVYPTLSPTIQDEVTGLMQEIDYDFLTVDISNLIAESMEGVTRVKQIVHDLKSFSHVDEYECQWADLHKGIETTLNIVRNEIKYKADVIREYGDIPEIECFPSQLNQVFMNLIVNAAQAITDHGVIKIRTYRLHQQVCVEISDTGSGMDEKTLKKIFDPFFTTKPVGQGTGLGLSLSYSIVRKHHGSIEVKSEIGKGSTFTVYLPIRQADDSELKAGLKGVA